MSAGKHLVSALLLAALALLPGLAFAGGNANFVLAGRGVDERFWAPTEDHGTFGVTVDFGKKSWPVNIALGLHGSAASEDRVRPIDLGFGDRLPDLSILPNLPDLAILDTEIVSTISEFSAGVLWRPRGESSFLPYVGGGIALVTAEKEFRLGRVSLTEDDGSGGLYVNGGVAWRIGKHFNIGLDGRFVAGTDIQIFDEKGDADYFQVGVLLGYGW